MAAYTSNPIIDPDFLTYVISSTPASANAELIVDTTNLKIILKVFGNLTTDGVTIKCVYSKLKEIWKSDANLIKFAFPMGPITDEQFELINGWNFDQTFTSGASAAKTVQLLRTGGWAVVNTSGVNTEMWAGIITLGSVGSTDQIYIQQASGAASTNILLTGVVNQAVQIYSDPNGDGNVSDGYDRRSFFKIFTREYQKQYAQAALSDIGVTSMTYQTYRFPLANSADLKVTNNDTNVSTLTPYTNINITYLRDSNNALYVIRGNFASATAYVVGNVVKDTGNNRWYKCILGYTSTATLPSANPTNWSAYEGERLIGSTYYAYTTIIDGDTTVGTYVSGAATAEQIYEKVQYQLRQNSDIDAHASGTVTGKTADSLLRFVGDTLVTSSGVYVDSFKSTDTNRISFTDYSGTVRTFPFVAALILNFGDNLKNDTNAIYRVFFTNDDAGDNTGRDFGTTNAILVQDNSSANMAGNVGGQSSVSLSFNYDGNTQRGAASVGTDAPITVVGLGLATGQYVKATGTIARSTSNTVSLVAPIERNFSNPA
jgi:hypothetical protein